MLSLLYVSQTTLDDPDRADILEEILSTSTDRNSRLDLTGLLIVAKRHFAELLEGAAEHVDQAMMDILADRRRGTVVILRRRWIDNRLCPRWQMVRLDSENFGDGAVTPVMMGAYRDPKGPFLHRLDDLIERLMLNETRS